jgi:hypothetical protein
MVKKWNEFILEFNNSDKKHILEVGNQLTFAVEYELCANEDPIEEPPVDDYESAAEHVKQSTLLTVKRKISYGHKFDMTIEAIDDFISYIMYDVIDLYDDDETDGIYDDILNPNNYKGDTKQFVIETLASNVMRFMDSQNIDYLIDKVSEELPNFYKKYGKSFKYELEGDNDKQRIIEFSPKTYITGISNTVEQLNDFFSEFERQDYWYFNNRTSLHFNIGSKEKLNPLKGLILMGDFNRDSKVPYVFKGIEHRLDNIHVGSMLDKLKRLLLGELDNNVLDDQRNYDKLGNYKDDMIFNIDKLNLNDISTLETYLNDVLLNTNLDFWVKEFGLNITQYKNNYVEFRFIGGDVKKEIVLEKLYYFSYITYAMSDSSYKRKEYLKSLYKFVEDLKQLLKK